MELAKNRAQKETEEMLMAAQDQALKTNNIKSEVDRVFHPYEDCVKRGNNWLCGWLWLHNRVAPVVHWMMCKRYGFPTMNNYEV